MKLPDVPTASAASSGVSGYGRTSTVNNPFAGYPTASSETRAPSGRETSGQASGAAGRDYQGNAAADALLEAEKAARRAPMEVATKLTAGLTVGPSGQSAASESTGVPQSPSYSSSSSPVQYTGQPLPYPVGSTAPQVGYTPGEIFRDFNDQRAKIEFSSQKAEAAAPNVARPADPSLLPYTIFAGTIIPAALETAINTDLPGDVLATVAENVYRLGEREEPSHTAGVTAAREVLKQYLLWPEPRASGLAETHQARRSEPPACQHERCGSSRDERLYGARR